MIIFYRGLPINSIADCDVDITLVSTIQSFSRSEDIGKSFSAFSTLANTAEAASGLLSGLFAMIGLLSSFIGMSFLIALTGLIAMKRIHGQPTPENHNE
ncbi:hypothetical protein PSI22_10365 [Xenorhabdus sp. XENO-7]|uniref:MFS transporter n=1 Tax=Xenorhabdus aichiensis TaxID=3025874 RepID=A0ABT5M2Z4_9GAMM|nr:hypothetical protein [Xenorhabdus aichiensis]MDC9622034.1 hypothetical protein [Xenorhabdus aichiensis]